MITTQIEPTQELEITDTLAEIRVGIGETARIIDVAPHTIRYWEKEFKFYLRPSRTKGKQRRYDEDVLSRLRKIKYMLKEENYSIAGARRILLLEIKGEDVLESVNVPQKELSNHIAALIRKELHQQITVLTSSGKKIDL